MILETPWDIFSVIVGVASVAYDVYHIATTGEGWADLGMDLFGLGVDIVAMLLPGVPGGVSVANRAARTAYKAVEVGRKIDTGINAYQAAQSGINSYKAFSQGDILGGTLNLVGAGLGGTHFALRAPGAFRTTREFFGSHPRLNPLNYRPDVSCVYSGLPIKGKYVGPKKGPYRGGSHRDMSGAQTRGDGLDSHHMPSRDADPSTNVDDGPAIQMDLPDHYATSSNGRQGAAGARYRAETARLIQEGRYRDAMAREIKDVRRAADEVSNDPRKYYEAIREMLDYARKSGQLPGRID